ncbi:MAG: hypothetical protein JJE18_00595 [Eubacteriaceae bacterium]|nr:hypothetical protein [Eubacteriaceae bacterium]
MNIIMLLIVAAIVIPGYLMISRLSSKLYSYNAKMDEETKECDGLDCIEERRDETEKESEIQDEERKDKNKSEIKHEESKDENKSEIQDEEIIIETQS